MTATDDDLTAAVHRAVAELTLGISDALGPVRPVSGVQPSPRRRSKVLLRAMRRAYVDLAAIDAQMAYDSMTPPRIDEPEPHDPLDDLPVAEPPSQSVRAIPAGLPTLGKGHR